MLIAMGILLVAAIIYLALTSGGSAKAVGSAADKMWAYIDENYPRLNIANYGESPEHLGANSYSLLVSDADCGDICFYVTYTNGNITDDYDYRVSKMSNTLLRLEWEMGGYFGNLLRASDTDIIRAEVTFPPRVRNDIPDSIYLGVEFDPTHPIFRGSTLVLVCEATEDMDAVAELIEKAHAAAKSHGILFYDYSVYGMESGDVYMMEIGGITAEAVEKGQLREILTSVMTGNITVSESDIEGITVKLY